MIKLKSTLFVVSLIVLLGRTALAQQYEIEHNNLQESMPSTDGRTLEANPQLNNPDELDAPRSILDVLQRRGILLRGTSGSGTMCEGEWG